MIVVADITPFDDIVLNPGLHLAGWQSKKGNGLELKDSEGRPLHIYTRFLPTAQNTPYTQRNKHVVDTVIMISTTAASNNSCYNRLLSLSAPFDIDMQPTNDRSTDWLIELSQLKALRYSTEPLARVDADRLRKESVDGIPTIEDWVTDRQVDVHATATKELTSILLSGDAFNGDRPQLSKQ